MPPAGIDATSVGLQSLSSPNLSGPQILCVVGSVVGMAAVEWNRTLVLAAPLTTCYVLC